MFKEFLAALTGKISQFLVSHPDFLEKDSKSRETDLKELSVPDAFLNYLKNVDGNSFMDDMKIVVSYTESEKTNISGNAFFEAVVSFFASDLGRKVDHLDTEYYLLPQTERISFIEKLVKGDSQLADAVRGLLINKTYQQLSKAIYSLANKVSDAPLVVVQTPREINSELKKDIRANLLEENANVFPIFQINQKLIGGMRIFKNGKTIDHSWLSRVHKFTSLTAVK